MSALDELRLAFQEILDTRAPAPRFDRGLLGDGDDNLWVASDSDNRAWFRKNGQASQLTKVTCWRVRPIYGMPVVCGFAPEQPGTYQVLSWDREALELNWSGMSSVPRHAEMHIWEDSLGGDDPVMVWTRAFMPFRVSPQVVLDMTVQVQGPEVYLWQTGWKEWLGDASVDLAGSRPGAGLHRYSLVSIDGATSTAQVTDGTAVGLGMPIGPGGWPQPPSGSIPLGLIYLTATTAIITEDEIVDGRVIVGSAGGSVAPAWPCWNLVVAHCNGDYDKVSDAVAYLDALTAAGDPDAPAANKPWTIWMMGGYYTDNTANITLSQYINLRAMGEGSILDLGDYELIQLDDTSVQDIVVISTGDDGNVLCQVNGDNTVQRNVRLILTGAGNDCLRLNNYTGIELYHVVLETTAAASTAIYCDGATALLWDVKVDDTTNWGTAGLYLDNGSIVTTKFCEFRANGDDVLTVAGTTWHDIGCNYSNHNIVAGGTHTEHYLSGTTDGEILSWLGW